MANDEWRLDGLPVRRKARLRRFGILRLSACGQGIQSIVFARQFSRNCVNAAHLDAAPEAAETQPRLPFLINDNIRVDRIEIIRSS